MMGDEDNHPDTSASTPNSSTNPQNQTKAPKDRSCPFCGQAFTSSSLGRHLDLYIKPKNPKPADGIHNVVEIRKIRGNITRRQPRTGGKVSVDHGRSSTGGPQDENGGTEINTISAHKPLRANSDVPEDSPIVSPVNAKDLQEGQTLINHANWQATGVINNIPPRAPSRSTVGTPTGTGQARRIDEMRRDTGGNRIQRPEYESEGMWRLQQDAELGRAAEMALREVLGSLEAATKKVEPRTIFDEFDFYSLSFPGLCLAILPPPGTLFSPTPFPSAESWTIGPPGLRQFEAMNRFLNERITAKRRVEHVPDSVSFRHHSHMSGAWEHWQSMSENDRGSAWTLEILRSFTRSQDQKRQLRSDLEHSQQRTRHLEAEYDRLSRCQLPREYLSHPPNTMPVSPNVMREVRGNPQYRSEAAEMNYDAEALISKWKSSIKATARPPKVAQQPASNASGANTALYAESSKNQLRDDFVMNGAIWNVGGPMPRNRGYEGEPLDNTPVNYETPPNPGAVEEVDTSPRDADADAEGEVEDTEQNALVRRMNGTGAHYLNANGKRPGSTGGGGAPTKVYRAHVDDRGG